MRFRVVDLPPGLLAPSPVEPNVRDVAVLQSHLRVLIGLPEGRAPSRREIALVLPDLCARTTLLTLETLPSRAAERDALVRWRLEKDAAVPPAGARVASRVVGPRSVLAVVAAEPVLRQFETLCDGLGLAPVRVETAAFTLEPLWRASSSGDGTAGCLSLLDEGFTLVIRHAGRPAFLRTKVQSPKILDDLAASLASYEESHPDAPLRRLHLIGEGPEPDLAARLSKELGLEVVPLGRADLQRVWRAPVSAQTPPAALPAVAALAPAREGDERAPDLSGGRHAHAARACAALAAVSLLLLGLIAWDLRDARAVRDQAAAVERTLALTQEQDRRVRHEAQTEGVDLSDPVLARLPGQVAFVNELIAKRAFSWTRFLSDLEDAVPPRVSINHIRPDLKGEVITIDGSALSLKDLTDLVISLEDHRAFRDANLTQHRVEENGIVDFSLTVRYQSQAKKS